MQKTRLSKYSHWAVLLGFVTVLLVFAVQLIPNVTANSDQYEERGFTIIHRDAVTYGKTSGEWAGEWWQWALSIPYSEHPLANNPDCSVGQSGPVWFLGGSFVTNTAIRNCTIPAGTYLFFPILNGEDSALEESQGAGCSNPPINDASIVYVCKCVESYENGVNLSAEIDGVSIPNIAARYRVQSPAYSITLPTDNVFANTASGTFPGGTYFPSITDGYYLMLAPLRPGPHKIHFHGIGNNNSFQLDITYFLTVLR